LTFIIERSETENRKGYFNIRNRKKSKGMKENQKMSFSIKGTACASVLVSFLIWCKRVGWAMEKGFENE